MQAVKTKTKLRRSSPRRPCPICGGQGCGQGPSVTLCWRVESPKQAVSGAWLHFDESAASAYEPPRVADAPLASIERRHAVYSAFLASLRLFGRHREHLQAVRCLSLDTIGRAEFRTVPNWNDADATANRIAERWELTGVPGFWKKDGRWRVRFAGCRGFYIPIRNQRGQIEALQIRTDNGETRYLLLSSSELPGGTSSGAPAHHTTARGAYALITEGALKAEIIAELTGQPVIGLVAVGTFGDDFGRRLRLVRPEIRAVGLAFDADWRTNEKVQKQLRRLSAVLRGVGLGVELVRWNGAQKGYDDWLIAKEGAR